MLSYRWHRIAGAASVVGGVLWVAHAAALALRPPGCVGQICDNNGATFRSVNDLALLTDLASVLLIVTLLILRRQPAVTSHPDRRFRAMGLAGIWLAIVGLTLTTISSLIQSASPDGDSPLIPFFVIPGLLLLVVGTCLLSISAWQVHVAPRWLLLLVILSAVVLLGYNDQNAQSWLGVPFGLACSLVGGLLLAGKSRYTGNDDTSDLNALARLHYDAQRTAPHAHG